MNETSNHIRTAAADLQLDAPHEIARWRPLVHWVLAIPHLVIANALSSVANALTVVSWFSIVFTGRLPVGIARFQSMILRYEARAYSFVAFMRERYPQFEYDMADADPGTDPLRVDLTTQLEGRNRLTVAFRIVLIIPIFVYGLLVGVAALVATFVAAIAVLVTGRWPSGLRHFVVGAGRLSVRVGAYVRLLTDTYPSFTLHA